MARGPLAEARADSAPPPQGRPSLRRLLDRDFLWATGLALATAVGLAALVTAVRVPVGQPKWELLACIPAFFARRFALPVMLVGAVGTAIELGAGSRVVALSVVLGVGTYFVASQRPRRESVPITMAVATGLGITLATAALRIRFAPLSPDMVEGFLPLTAAWFVGDSVAARRKYLAGLEEQAARERRAEIERAHQQVREERVRIARELHDVLAHTLAVITVQSGVGRRLMDRRPEEAATALESIENIGRTAQDELRVVLALLRDEESERPALAPAPRLVDLKDVVDNVRLSGTPVEVRIAGEGRSLSPALELTVYRVVQEALTNVVRHAPGAQATVDISVGEDEVRVLVTDNGSPAGAPIGQKDTTQGTGHGIAGMRERVGAFGGALVAGPLPSGGFRVSARLPVEGAA